MHYIRTSLIYSMRKVFVERAVVELVYNSIKKIELSAYQDHLECSKHFLLQISG